MQFFYICLHVQVDLIRIFFNSRFSSIKSQSQQKLAKKFSHFIVQFRSKSLIHLMNLNLNLNDIENNMLPQHSKKSFFTLQIFQQTCFCLVSEKQFAEMVQYYFLTPKSCNNSWNTLKANVCVFLYISVKKFFQRSCKIWWWGGWEEGGWIIFLRWFGSRKMLFMFWF